MTSPTPDHDDVVHALERWLIKAEDAGHGVVRGEPPGIVVNAEGRVRQPDLFFIRAGREQFQGERDFLGAPDFIIEVLSPSTRRLDLPGGAKWLDYERLGVPAYSIADPATRRVAQYARQPEGRYGQPLLLTPGDELLSPLSPEIALPATQVFAAMRQPERPLRGLGYFRLPKRGSSA